jgi:hypothetical protein
MSEARAEENVTEEVLSKRDLPLLRSALALPASPRPAARAAAPTSRAASELDGPRLSLSNKLAATILHFLGFLCERLSRVASNVFWNN